MIIGADSHLRVQDLISLDFEIGDIIAIFALASPDVIGSLTANEPEAGLILDGSLIVDGS